MITRYTVVVESVLISTTWGFFNVLKCTTDGEVLVQTQLKTIYVFIKFYFTLVKL